MTVQNVIFIDEDSVFIRFDDNSHVTISEDQFTEILLEGEYDDV